MRCSCGSVGAGQGRQFRRTCGLRCPPQHTQLTPPARPPALPGRHGAVRVEDSEDDLYAAVDLVADKLKRKLVKVRWCVGASAESGLGLRQALLRVWLERRGG